MTGQHEELINRFGIPANYQNFFINIDTSSIRDDFASFNSSNRGKSIDVYEVTRQRFLKLLSKPEIIWRPTSKEWDVDVEISRIYGHDANEFLAFMRIQPHGFRTERIVPTDIHIVFHVLVGRVLFTYKKRTKTLSRGQHIAVNSRSLYSIRCLNLDQPAYLIFRIAKRKKREKVTTSDQQCLTSSENLST